MTIDKEPFYQERKYWGTINIPTIQSAYGTDLIDFAITKWESTADVNHPSEGVQIHITVKNKDFTTFRGKERKFIYEQILEQIKLQNITL